MGHTPSHREVAEAVREACLDAALSAYEDARIAGLCHEGAWEAAVSAVRRLDLERITNASATPPSPGVRS